MSLLFAPRPAQHRRRAVSNGGLGGLVRIEATELIADGTSRVGTWPKKVRQPPPLQFYHDTHNLAVPAAPWSAGSTESGSNGWPQHTTSSLEEDLGLLANVRNYHLSPLMSRFNSACSNSVATETSKSPLTATPVELPGSLLLPRQGFPPPPIATPQRIELQRQDTYDSELSTVPSLTTSVSTITSSDNMDLLKGLSTHHWKASASNGGHSNANGNVNKQPSSVSKPFSAMSIEELLASLPKYDYDTIARIWLPEMHKKCSHMKQLLQKSHKGAVHSDDELKTIGHDIKLFMQEARTVSNTYESALRSAESLIERDTLNLQERLHLAETDLNKAHADLSVSEKTRLEKEEIIVELGHTLYEVVRLLGGFIQRNVEHWVDDFQEPETQSVLQIIADYGPPFNDSDIQYIRIPESLHSGLVSAAHDAREQTAHYRAIAKNQDAMIKDQSKQMDQQLDKYEQTIKTIKERDHKVMLLCQRNTNLEGRVETYETALQRSQAVITEGDRMKKENEELRQEIKQLTGFFKLQLDEKDAKLADMGSKLGNAREEVLARRADVRNVIAQTQALMVPPSQDVGHDHTSGKILGRSRDRGKKHRFPHSESSTFLGLQHLNIDLMTSPNAASRASPKERGECDKAGKSFHLSCASSSSNSARTASSTPTHGRRASDPFSDIRPRNESLGALERDGTSTRSSADIQEQLPAAPPTLLPQVPTANSLQRPNEALSDPPRTSWPAMPTHSTPASHDSINPSLRTPGKRILSLIPEASHEDSESVRAPSATSSEREVYRRSVHALEFLNSSSVAEDDESGSGTVVETNEGPSRSSSEGSDVMTVSQMYHAQSRGQQRHLRG